MRLKVESTITFYSSPLNFLLLSLAKTDDVSDLARAPSVNRISDDRMPTQRKWLIKGSFLLQFCFR